MSYVALCPADELGRGRGSSFGLTRHKAGASLNAKAATALARASALDEITHAEQVVKQDLRTVLGGRAATGKSLVAEPE